jgi:hypothetical protein
MEINPMRNHYIANKSDEIKKLVIIPNSGEDTDEILEDPDDDSLNSIKFFLLCFFGRQYWGFNSGLHAC